MFLQFTEKTFFKLNKSLFADACVCLLYSLYFLLCIIVQCAQLAQSSQMTRTIIYIIENLQSIIREDSFKHKLSQCEFSDGSLPEFMVATKYLQSSMKLWGVTDLPRTFFGFAPTFIIYFSSLINFTNYGLNLFSDKVLRFCRSFSFSVGLTKVKHVRSWKNVFSFLRIEFFLSVLCIYSICTAEVPFWYFNAFSKYSGLDIESPF